MSLLEKATPEPSSVTVVSTAEPSAQALLLARRLVAEDDELAALFIQYKREERSIAWLADMLVPRILDRSEERLSFREAKDVCQYLADEFHQLGANKDALFLVSQETGRVVQLVGEEALYDPGLLPRDSGNEAPALLRLHPHIERAQILHASEKDRESHVLRVLTEKVVQTDLLREEGDRRLQVATRAGRRDIARELSEDDPWWLLRRASGSTGMFLRHVELVESFTPPDHFLVLEGVAVLRSTLGVQDMTTLNPSYNRLGTLRGVAPQAWIRDMARQLSHRLLEECKGPPLPADIVDAALVKSHELWIADPDVSNMMRLAQGRVMPVEGAETFGVSGQLGKLVVPRDFGVETREMSDRWQITATLPYTLYVDPGRAKALPLVGVARSAVLA